MPDTNSPWRFSLAVEDVPETGAHFDLAADEQVRAQIARIAGLRDLPRLTASFDVIRHGSGGLHVSGDVSATVGQNCVVTLEPVESELHEMVDIAFVPEEADPATGLPGETTVNFDQDDASETLSGGAVDLAAVATEFFLLGIDPYPRKDGAVFEPARAGDPAARPFAALAALKKDKGGTS